MQEDDLQLDAIGLVHVVDGDTGIRRIGAGKGFSYRKDNGNRLTDQKIITRIKALAIPPAWRDVWICPDPMGHIQATGRDERGRKQYRYHADWTVHRNAAKFSSLVAFATHLPDLREQVEADLRKRGLTRARVMASAVRLLDQTLIRIGNELYANENKSYGLTTLRTRHLELTGTKLRFSFKGKSGRSWSLSLSDRRVLRVMRDLQELPGQRLFQYLDDDGNRRSIRSQDVNGYIREVMGDDFSSKHFRTWGATVQAAVLLAEAELPNAQRNQAMVVNGVLDEVAKTLRNTRTVCRQNYVHPFVIADWQEGALSTRFRALRKRAGQEQSLLLADEALVLRWLKKREAEVRKEMS